MEKPSASGGQDLTLLQRLKVKAQAKAAVWILKGTKDGKPLQTRLLIYGIRKALADKEVTKMLEEIKGKLSGKKTYLVALAAIIGTVVAWVNGTLTSADAAQQVIEAVLACTIRSGISGSAKPQ